MNNRPRGAGSGTDRPIPAMAIVERHESPDRQLTLLVDVTDGDWTIGFDGCAWHTHGDMLRAWGCDGPPEAATRQFVDEILASRREICVYRIDGRITDASVPSLDDERPLQVAFARHAPPNETMQVRYWDGRPPAVTTLGDGPVGQNHPSDPEAARCPASR